MEFSNKNVAVCCCQQSHRASAEALASCENILLVTSLSDPRLSDVAVVLVFDDDGMSMQGWGDHRTGKVKVDFLRGKLAYRGGQEHLGGELIAKAVGVSKYPNSRILDATAGLARDSFILAKLGCRVTMVEKSNIIASLIEDGMGRGNEDPKVAEVLARIRFLNADSMQYMKSIATHGEQRPDVVYLDPMFPGRHKSAKVKKEMGLFQLILDDDAELEPMLEQALKCAKRHVVVKRPVKASQLHGFKPSHSFCGRSSRFDVFVATY